MAQRIRPTLFNTLLKHLVAKQEYHNIQHVGTHSNMLLRPHRNVNDVYVINIFLIILLSVIQATDILFLSFFFLKLLIDYTNYLKKVIGNCTVPFCVPLHITVIWRDFYSLPHFL